MMSLVTGTRLRASLACLAAASWFAGMTGCSRPVKLVPADGVVTIGGKPTEGVVVQFLPSGSAEEKRPSSFGTTGADGTFQLTTQDGKPGAVEGRHAVLLIDTLEDRPAQGTRVAKPPRLDPKYTTVAGGLSAEVVENGGPIKLDVPAP
ncbi:MAG: hypothetical protein ACKO4Z_15000 [Planctomycetota bacterium]